MFRYSDHLKRAYCLNKQYVLTASTRWLYASTHYCYKLKSYLAPLCRYAVILGHFFTLTTVCLFLTHSFGVNAREYHHSHYIVEN